MNTDQINKILRQNVLTAETFLGCAPSDKIPITDLYPYAVVVNTDDSSRPGEHWVALYVPSEDTVEYFDSYGDEPNENLSHYIGLFPDVKRSEESLQSLFSKVCGQYCIYFVIQRCLGRSFDDIVAHLRELINPDFYVARYVSNSL